MSREKRNLVAREIRNLTNEEMWAYGTSGMLVQLKRYDPEKIMKKLMLDELHPENEPGVYYVTDGKTREKLESNWKFSGKLVTAKFYGTTREEQRLHRFYNENGDHIVPLGDDVGPMETDFSLNISLDED